MVGGGAGGLELVTRLGKKLGGKGRAQVTLIDSHRTHIWKPLLHQIAAGSSDESEHAIEYLRQARWQGFRFRLGEMVDLDRVAKRVMLSPVYDESGEVIIPARSFHYDTLVLAVGSIGHDFGIEGVQQHCMMLDTKAEAVFFQRKLLNIILRAQTQQDEIKPGQLDVAIVGGGATGVELAAQLHHVSRKLATYGIDEFKPDQHMHIHVIDASPRILPALPERLSADVTRELNRLGVEVITSARVTKVTQDGIIIDQDKLIPAAIKVWAAGIKAPDFLAGLGLETNKINQVMVNHDLTSSMDENIFCIGDCASFPIDEQGNTVPPRAQAAHQQASFVARAIMRRFNGRAAGRYVYRDYGALVTLGKYSTVGSLMGGITGSVRISGFIARMVYFSLYKSHQLAIFGWWRTILLTLALLLRRTVNPSIKLH